MGSQNIDNIIKALRGCSKASCASCVYNKPDNASTCVDNLKKDAADALERMINFIESEETEENMEAEVKTDNINAPAHYNREGAIQSIDEMIYLFGKKTVADFCLCNVWKYRYRAADKNGAEDIAKSDWYMRKYIELTEGE